MEFAEDEKQSGVKNFLRKKVATVLLHYLGKYLKNITSESIKTRFGKESCVILNDIRLREDALKELRIPVMVLPNSVVKEIQCNIQVLVTQPNVKITLKDVMINATLYSHEWSKSDWEKYKTEGLEEWEKNQKHQFQALESKGFFTRKFALLLNNINLSIENLVICIFDPETLGYLSAVRFSLTSLRITTTNENFIEKISENLHSTFREITIEDFSAAVACDRPEIAGSGSQADDNDIVFSERELVIHPFSFSIKHALNHEVTIQDFVHKFTIDAQEVNFTINEVQLHYLQTALNMIQFKNTMKQYEENKPKKSEIYKGGEQKWWNYIIGAAKQDLKKKFVGIVRVKADREEYIDYYKKVQTIIHSPWLLQHQEVTASHPIRLRLLALESQYTLEELINFRTLALYQLRIEAMSYIKARGNVLGKTHLGDLWDFYLNDFDSLLGSTSRNVDTPEEIELTGAEKDELNCLLNMDKLLIIDSYLNGKSSELDDNFVSLNLTIDNCTLFLQQTLTDRPGKHRVFKRACSETHSVEECLPVKFLAYDFNRHPVMSIVMINENGGLFDKKLIRERTLLVLEASNLHVTTQAQRNLSTNVELKVQHFIIYDPMCFVYQKKFKTMFNRKYFKDRKKHPLLESILKSVDLDQEAAYAVRFFFEDIGLLPELEFLIHFLQLHGGGSRIDCICQQYYEHEEELLNEFIRTNGKYSLGIEDAKIAMIEASLNKMEILQEIYDHIQNNIEKYVMTELLSFTYRWMKPKKEHLVPSRRQKQAHLAVFASFVGKPSPVRLKFLDKNKRVSDEEKTKLFEEIKNDGEIRVVVSPFEVVLSTSTCSRLFEWMSYSPRYERFTADSSKLKFTSAIEKPMEELEFMSMLCKYSLKTKQQLESILKDTINDMPNIETSIDCSRIEFIIYESKFQYKQKHLSSHLVLDSLVLVSKRPNVYPDQRKFYRTQKVSIGAIKVICNEVEALHTTLNLTMNTCILQNHMKYPDFIVECSVKYFTLIITNELISLLGIITNVNTKKPKAFELSTRELIRIKKRIDKKKFAKRMHAFLNNHCQQKAKRCMHCLLKGLKVRKHLNIAIGERSVTTGPIKITINDRDAKVDLATFQTNFILCCIEERPFQNRMFVYSTLITNERPNSSRNYESLEIYPKEIEESDIREFSTFEHLLTPDVIRAFEGEQPVYLLLQEIKPINEQLFDTKKWLEREREILYDGASEETEVSQILIEKVSIRLKTSLDQSNWTKAIASLYLIHSVLSLYKEKLYSVDFIPQKNLIEKFIIVNKVRLKCIYQGKFLKMKIDDLVYKQWRTKKSFNQVELLSCLTDKKEIYIRNITFDLCGKLLTSIYETRLSLSSQVSYTKPVSGSLYTLADCVVSKTKMTIEKLSVRRTEDGKELFLSPGTLTDASSISHIGAKHAVSLTITRSRVLRATKSSMTVAICPVAIVLPVDFLISSASDFTALFSSKIHETFSFYLSCTERYEFFACGRLAMQVTSDMTITLGAVSLSIRHLEEFSLKILMRKAKMVLPSDSCEFSIDIKSLQVVPDQGIYSDLLLDKKNSPGAHMRIVLNTVENSLELTLLSANIIFLNKTVQEVLYVLEEMTSKLRSAADSPTASSGLKVLLIVEDAELYIPESCWSSEGFRVSLKSATVTVGNSSCSYKVPEQLQGGVESPQSHSQVTDYSITEPSSQLELNIQNATVQLKTLKVVEAQQLTVNFFSPSLAMKLNNWTMKNLLQIQLFNASLVGSLTDFLSLQKLLKANLEESPRFTSPASVYRRLTKLRIRIEEGSGQITRWLTTPLPCNLNINGE